METIIALIAKIQESPMASGIVLAALVGWAGFVTNKLPNVLVSLLSRLFVNRLIYEGAGTYDQSRAFDTAMQFFDKMEPNRIFAGGASPSLRSAYEATGTKKSLLGPRFGGLYTVKISNTRIFFQLTMDGYSNFGKANMRLTVYVPVWASLSKINDAITGTPCDDAFLAYPYIHTRLVGHQGGHHARDAGPAPRQRAATRRHAGKDWT